MLPKKDIGIYLIPVNELAAIYEQADPIIELYLKKQDRYVLADIHSMLESGEGQLWAAISDKVEAVVITLPLQFTKARICFVQIVAGERYKDWVPQMNKALEDYYLCKHGFDSLETVARKGWLKVLKDWTCEGYVMRKRL